MDVFEQYELDRFKEIVARGFWHFAKTAAKTNPHWYIVRKELNADKDFDFAVMYIREHGKKEWLWGRSYICLYIDGWKYWTMGDPLDQTWILNKTHADWKPKQ